MRSIAKTAFLAIAVVTCLLGNVRANADDKMDIEATYLAGQNALKKKDLNAFLKTCTSDFVMTQMDGKKQNVSSMKEQFKSNFSADTKVETCVIKMLSCRIKGDTANASSLAHMKIKTKGPDGKPMVIESTDNAQDILVKTPQGWKFKASKSVDTKVSVNGKMVDPSKMAPPKKK